MKMKYRLNHFVLGSLLILIGCTSEEQITDNEETRIEEIHSFEESSEVVSLNKGERWQANLETTEGIGQMRTKMDGFNQDAELTEYQLLSAELSADFALIFKKCTLTGPAHDQLHNYLLPMRIYFKQMKSSDLEERRVAFNSLLEWLNEYEVYFK